MGTISDNFSYAEFEASETAAKKGIRNVITSIEVRNAVKELVLTVLQPLRDRWGKPLEVNSGYRCPVLNALVGGVATSQHTRGEAADINAPNPIRLAQLAYDTPEIWREIDQMIVYPTFVHFSHRHGGPQRHQLLYNKSYRGTHVRTRK